MVDLAITDVTTPLHDVPVTVSIRDGAIVAIGSDPVGAARKTLDGRGRCLLPPFVDAHFHLDSVLTRIPNASGTLREGIDNWARYKETSLTAEDVYTRAKAYCEQAFAMGIQAIRSHVDVCDPALRGAEGLIELRRELAGRMDIQLIAFPQDGYYGGPHVRSQLERALDMGVDVVGGIPHNEPTYNHGTESLRELLELAADRGLLVDIHCDETDDPHSRHVETLAAECVRVGLQGRVAASHITSTAVMDRYYLSRRLIPLMAAAELSVIVNPLINVHLGGHFSHPMHRAMAPIRDFIDAGLTVACGQDCNEDPWYPIGYAEMFEVLKMGAHIGHMMGLDALRSMLDTVTANPARIMRLTDYGLEVGKRAHLVLLDAPTWFDAMRTNARRVAVIRNGVVSATPARTRDSAGG